MTASNISIIFLGKINKRQAEETLRTIFNKAGVDFEPTLKSTNESPLCWSLRGHEREALRKIADIETLLESRSANQEITPQTKADEKSSYAWMIKTEWAINGSSVKYYLINNDYS